ncbi:hypothetical protein LTR70_002790 [Exophiala xenobiotica]|uniref:C3H1-type domain-containing protein n=1 Tax=Lithohypha guttulata TaxID=1690604 RepID=A0ABR0KIV8_9EURO|nr:hypothetical protein LTR24_002004 [Lithohypha guttulata]KAK5324506.1 hypothetical protein LTR70_002790 [Exophiala xenobiotica]
MDQNGRHNGYRGSEHPQRRGTSQQQQKRQRSPQDFRPRTSAGNQGGRWSPPPQRPRQYHGRQEHAYHNSRPPQMSRSTHTPPAPPSSTQYKSKGTLSPRPCRYYQQGRCRQGSSCAFSHAGPTPQPTNATPRPPQAPDPYNADDELTDEIAPPPPFPPPQPPSHTAPPPIKPLPTPTLLQRAQDHATNDPALRQRHPTLTPPRWYLCTLCASQTPHTPAHIISNPYLFTSLRLKDDATLLQDDINGAYIWAIGDARLPIQCKLVDEAGPYYTCEYLLLRDALYMPDHGVREVGMGMPQGVNTLCLAALERDGVAGHAYVFGGVVFVEFGFTGAVMWGVERSVRGDESVWEVVLCRRGDADREKGHVCGVGVEGNRMRVGGGGGSEGSWRGESRNEMDMEMDMDMNGRNGGWKPKSRSGKHVQFEGRYRGRSRGSYSPDNWSRIRGRSRSRHRYQ